MTAGAGHASSLHSPHHVLHSVTTYLPCSAMHQLPADVWLCCWDTSCMWLLSPSLASQATSISPWVITLEALEAFQCLSPEQQPSVLPYLREDRGTTYDIQLEVLLQPEGAEHASTVAVSNLRHMCAGSAAHVQGCVPGSPSRCGMSWKLLLPSTCQHQSGTPCCLWHWHCMPHQVLACHSKSCHVHCTTRPVCCTRCGLISILI